MTGFTIYGCGSWGSTLALHLLRKGMRARLWDVAPSQRARVSDDPEFRNFLPGFAFLPTLQVIDEEGVPDPGDDPALLAVPSHALREVAAAIRTGYRGPWVIATKGLEEKTDRKSVV